MGKISDALEKADKQPQTVDVLPRDVVKRDAQKQTTEVNVVQLSPPTKSVKNLVVDDRLIAYHAPRSVEGEIFKLLRTNIFFKNQGKTPRAIMITSPEQGDGKSFIAANLAVMIAQGVEEHVLLIDSDIRNPVVHKYFGYGIVEGLSEHLHREYDISKIMIKTVIPKLSIIPGGKPPLNPTELLSSKKMKSLIEEVRMRYDDRYIVIDTPPLSVASETFAMAKFVDGILLVIRSGKTRRKEIERAIEQLGKDKILGIVFNDSNRSLKKYYGYGNYKHQ
jgi:exopolysaccharide/PEP-CTERM locus tyrosine autokinase